MKVKDTKVKEKTVAKEPEVDIFQLFEQAQQRAPQEEEKYLTVAKEALEKANKIRTMFLNKPPLTLSEGPQTLKKPQGATKPAAPKANQPPMPDGPPPEGTDRWKFCGQCQSWGNHDARFHRKENLAAAKAARQ